GTLDSGWVPLLPLAKGGTGTATPRTTRNLCVYVASASAPAPTIPLPSNLQSCVATRAFASAREAPNVSWTFVTANGATLFAPFSFTAGNGQEAGLPDVPLIAGAIVWPVVTPQGTFHEATYCLQVSCEASF